VLGVYHRTKSVQKAVEEMQRFYSACTTSLGNRYTESKDVACQHHGEGSTHRKPDMIETTISQPPPLTTGKGQGSMKKGKSKKEKP
jgi:DnaJ-class molecular chaperone